MAGLQMPQALHLAEQQRKWLVDKHIEIATQLMAGIMSGRPVVDMDLESCAALATDAATVLLAQYGFSVHLKDKQST